MKGPETTRVFLIFLTISVCTLYFKRVVTIFIEVIPCVHSPRECTRQDLMASFFRWL